MSNYVYGSSLSDRDYLQARSFEDAIRSEISAQTRSLIASSEQLHEEHISLSKSLQSTFSEGFAAASAGLEQLSFDLQSLTTGVSELTATFHWGMSELLVAVGHVNDKLADLVRIAKTPAQTWAYEQFDIARDAFRQELYPEALEYLNRAINGHVGNTGYKLEYRFHFLWGTIRLGSAKNTSPDVVNLSDAENAFLSSARYARRDEPNEAGRVFLAAGWAAYCQGKMDTARESTEQAVALFPGLAEAHFQLAKIQMHVGAAEPALVSLRRAIELERAYAIKAASDGDFQRHEAKVQALLKDLCHQAKERANCELLAAQQEVAEAERENVQEFSLPKLADLTQAKRALEDAKSAIRVDTYFGYLDAFTCCGRAKEALQHVRRQFVARGSAETLSLHIPTRRAFMVPGAHRRPVRLAAVPPPVAARPLIPSSLTVFRYHESSYLGCRECHCTERHRSGRHQIPEPFARAKSVLHSPREQRVDDPSLLRRTEQRVAVLDRALLPDLPPTRGGVHLRLGHSSHGRPLHSVDRGFKVRRRHALHTTKNDLRSETLRQFALPR